MIDDVLLAWDVAWQPKWIVVPFCILCQVSLLLLNRCCIAFNGQIADYRHIICGIVVHRRAKIDTIRQSGKACHSEIDSFDHFFSKIFN